MKTKFLGSTMLAVLGWQTASAVEVSWYRQPGSALHIASNASASLWMVGTDPRHGQQRIQMERHGIRQAKLFRGPKLGVTTTDQLWVVNESRLDLFIPGGSSALLNAEGARGCRRRRQFRVDYRHGPAGGRLRRISKTGPGRSSLNFTYANFAAVRIAVDKAGNAWVVNETGEIYMYNIASKSWEHKGTKKARSVHTGASSGAVWMLGTDSIPGGFPIYQWDSAKQDWEPYGTYGAVEMTEAAGTPWIVQSDGKLYSRIEPTTQRRHRVDLTQTWPAPTPQEPPHFGLAESGKLLCSDTARLYGLR